jgi:hypothetical protein
MLACMEHEGYFQQPENGLSLLMILCTQRSFFLYPRSTVVFSLKQRVSHTDMELKIGPRHFYRIKIVGVGIIF